MRAICKSLKIYIILFPIVIFDIFSIHSLYFGFVHLIFNHLVFNKVWNLIMGVQIVEYFVVHEHLIINNIKPRCDVSTLLIYEFMNFQYM